VLWTVTAGSNALYQLAEIYLDAADTNAVSQASNAIDSKLATDPLSQGIESGPERILFQPPLGVVFEVKPKDRLVSIKAYYYLD
jgi:hypothetical protein